MTPSKRPSPSILIIGASRGLGHAMAAEFVSRGWHVVGTVRGGGRTLLHDLADANSGQVAIESLDINEPEQLTALRDRLDGRVFDILFVNAGISNRDPHQAIGEVSTAEFTEVMITNALSPMRVINALEGNIEPAGLVGVMSSGLGSISNNETGKWELYRGSKAALNMFMRSFAAKQAGTPLAMVLMAPGWIRTDLGGPDASFTIEESMPLLVDLLLAKRGKPGLEYLDRQGRTVPW